MTEYTESELAALKKEHAANATDEQFKLWIAECRTRNLAPVRDIIMQIRTSEEWDPEVKAKVKKKKSIYIVTIGAKRKIANATGLYAGQLPTKWIYLDSNNQPTVESEIPLPDPSNPQLPMEPWACRTSVLRTGFQVPLTVVSRFGAYCQTFKRNDEVQLTAIWSAGGRSCEMLEKCSESACLTRAFPSELGGLYIKEELMKDDVIESIPVAAEVVVEAPKAPVIPEVNHTPATPTSEPRPAEKTRTKKNVKDTTIADVVLDRVDVVDKNAPHEYVYGGYEIGSGGPICCKICGKDVDDPIHPKDAVNSAVIAAKPAENPVQKMDTPPKSNNDRLRDLMSKGLPKDPLKAYLLRIGGQTDIKAIPAADLTKLIEELEGLSVEDAVKKVNEKPESEEF